MGGRTYVHCQINKWSPSIRRECKVKWEQFKEHMRARGVTGLYSMVWEHDKTVNHWQVMFGQHLIGSEGGRSLYFQEI